MAHNDETKVQAGQPLQIPARMWNDMVELVRLYRRNKFSLRGMIESAALRPRITVAVKNEVGFTIADSYRILRLGDSLIDPTGDLHAANRRPGFYGYLPNGPEDAFAVLQSPAEYHGIAEGVVQGVTVCRVYMHDLTHEWAVPAVGSANYLQSAQCGQARILGLWPDSGNVYFAIVHLIGLVPCGGFGGVSGASGASGDGGSEGSAPGSGGQSCCEWGTSLYNLTIVISSSISSGAWCYYGSDNTTPPDPESSLDPIHLPSAGVYKIIVTGAVSGSTGSAGTWTTNERGTVKGGLYNLTDDESLNDLLNPTTDIEYAILFASVHNVTHNNSFCMVARVEVDGPKDVVFRAKRTEPAGGGAGWNFTNIGEVSSEQNPLIMIWHRLGDEVPGM